MPAVLRECIETLLHALESDIKHIERSIEWLNDLRAFVIKRDDEALAGLLNTIRSESDAYCANEIKRQSARQAIAAEIGCAVDDLTLTRLIAILPGEVSEPIAAMKARLTELTGMLKNEHRATAVLLADAARFNSALLTQVLNIGETSAVTYGSDGSTGARSGTAFVDMQF